MTESTPGQVEPAERASWMQSLPEALRGATPELWVYLGLFAVNLLLVLPSLTPDLSEISLFDEAAYINGGRGVWQGYFPQLAASPLVAAFYGLIYVPLRESPYWLVYSAWAGRVILFGFLWAACLLIGLRLRRYVSPLVILGLFLVNTIPVRLLSFPSDPLFVGMAALSFAQFIEFSEDHSLRSLGWSSLFLGLAALSRNDGLVIFPVLLLLAIAVTWRKSSLWQVLIAVSVPFLALTAGYTLFRGAMTGDFSLGTLGRTYDNFEAGHESVYRGPGNQDPVIEAKLEARRVFGTPEENNYSILNAIRRNPSVYLQRIQGMLRFLPRGILSSYDQRIAPLLFLFAAGGLVRLLKSRKYILSIASIAWAAPLGSMFAITLFREGHLMFPFYLVFGLASLGIGSALSPGARARDRWGWLMAIGLVGLYSVVDHKPAILFGASIAFAGLALAYWSQSLDLTNVQPAAPYLILLAAAIAVRGSFPGPAINLLGDSADEQAVLYIVENFEPGTRIAAGSPGIIYMTRMEYMGLSSTDVPANRSPEAFADWMRSQEIQAVYVDHSLWGGNPRLWELISTRIGIDYERVFVADEGDIQVLLIAEGAR